MSAEGLPENPSPPVQAGFSWRRLFVSPRGCRQSSEAAWWIVLAATVVGGLWLIFGTRSATYRPIYNFLVPGIIVTLKLVAACGAGALFVGIVAGLMRASRFRPFSLAASIYIELVRGIPLLVLLFMGYYGLQIGKLLAFGGEQEDYRFASAFLCFSIAYGAYLGEIVRAGIEAIPHEEIEAASLEANRFQSILYVVLPRAIRTILPAIGNEFIALLKDSSIVSIIAVNDLTRVGQMYAQNNFAYSETYLMVAVIYLGMTLLLSKLVKLMEANIGVT